MDAEEYSNLFNRIIAVSGVILLIITIYYSCKLVKITSDLQKSVIDNRSIKDIFISDLRGIKENYENLFQDLFLGNLQREEVLRHFKQNQIKVDSLRNISKEYFQADVLAGVSKRVISVKRKITELDEVEKGYKVKLQESTNTANKQLHKLMSDIYSAIGEINKL